MSIVATINSKENKQNFIKENRNEQQNKFVWNGKT